MSTKDIDTIFRKTYLIRACENAIIEEYQSDDIKTPVHLSIGAELISSVISYVFKEAKFFGTYRSHALFLAITENLRGFFGELYGKKSGISHGKAGSMHLFDKNSNILATSAIVGSTIPLAVGCALANKLKQCNDWTVVFMGDGSMEEGVFFESLNFCSLHNLKVLFVIEDNDLAIHITKKQRQAFADYSKIADTFSLNYHHVSGVDLENLLTNSYNILNSNTATILHCSYHRFYEHVGVFTDYKFNYRKQPQNIKELDPLNSFSSITNQELIQQEVDKLISEAIEFAKNDELLPVSEVGKHVY